MQKNETNILQSPYEVLGVAWNTPSKDLRKAYKKLIRQHTPEHDPENFMAIRAAYDFIVNPPDQVVQFPIYQKPLQFANEKKKNQGKKRKIDTSILKKSFETPFNTYLELKKLLEER